MAKQTISQRNKRTGARDLRAKEWRRGSEVDSLGARQKPSRKPGQGIFGARGLRQTAWVQGGDRAGDLSREPRGRSSSGEQAGG